MANVIKLKTGTSTPTTSDITNLEVAIDKSAAKLYLNDNGTIKEIGGGGGQTASELLTSIKTVDGSGSGLDADLLDGIHASSFARSDATDTITGEITLSNNLIKFSGTSNDRTVMHFIKSGEIKWRLLQNSYNAGGGDNLNFDRVNGTGIFMVDGYRVLTTNDEGTGNGLDADTLDGQEGSYYTNAANLTGTLPAIDGSNLTNLPSGGSTDKISEGNTEAEVVDSGSDGHFKVTTEGTEIFRINAFGAATFTNDVTVDTNVFKVNSSNNRVGVGTANPSETLDVYNSTNNSRVLRISHPQYPTDAAAFFGWSSDGSGTTNNLFNIGVQYSSSYYNVINIKRSEQKVGINNNNPSESLDVTGNIKASAHITGVSDSSDAAFIAKGDGSSQDGYIQLNCSQNSHGVKIKSPPHSANASYTLTLPNDTGSANQVLKTDGSGGLDWVDQTAAYTNASVDAHLNQSNPTSGYVLSWNGSDYAWVAQSGGGGGSGISNIVEDTTPQLGGNLDMQSNNITGTGTITATSVASSANGMRKITASTSSPSGGSDGDIWIKYTA